MCMMCVCERECALCVSMRRGHECMCVCMCVCVCVWGGGGARCMSDRKIKGPICVFWRLCTHHKHEK